MKAVRILLSQSKYAKQAVTLTLEKKEKKKQIKISANKASKKKEEKNANENPAKSYKAQFIVFTLY